MSQSVKMPALGESVTEGTVTRWLKAEGDEVAVDEPLLEVSTDKVDTEIPSPVAGVLEKILVAEDETAQVGAELATIGDGSGGGSDSESAGQDTATGSGADGTATGDAEKQAAPEPEATTESTAAPAEAPSTDTEQPAEKPRAGARASAGSGTSVTLPAMGESVTEGTVTRWLKTVGDEVAVDEPLLEVSTDKVDTEVPSPVAGTLLEITVGEDETVQVGGQLAVIGAAGSTPTDTDTQTDTGSGDDTDTDTDTDTDKPETQAQQPAAEPAPAPSQEQPEPERPAAPEKPAPEVSTPKDAQGPGTSAAATQAQPTPSPTESLSARGSTGGAYVTPVIRKLAHDNGVDLASVSGTGVGGRIRREDVVRAATAGAAAADAPVQELAPAAATGVTSAAPVPDEAATALIGTTQKTPRIRQTIAKNMVNALQTAAQLTSVVEVDVSRVAALRARAKKSFEAREGVKLSFLPFFVKAAVEAAKVHPVINSTISDDLKEITYHPSVNLGIAVDTPRGLVVPVIKNADDLNIGGIARKIADLADRTRTNKIGPDELSGGTFSLTNTGSVGALFDTAIFTPPQSAILITGAVVKRAVVVPDADGNDTIAIRSMAFLALSYDHRNVDGADAARFLGAVKKRIEGGEFEGDLGL